MCRKCWGGGGKAVEKTKQLELGTSDKIEVVEKFCYLGDVIEKGGGAEESSRARVRCAWGKFRDLKMLLTARGASLRVKGNIYIERVYRGCLYMVAKLGQCRWMIC